MPGNSKGRGSVLTGRPPSIASFSEFMAHLKERQILPHSRIFQIAGKTDSQWLPRPAECPIQNRAGVKALVAPGVCLVKGVALTMRISQCDASSVRHFG